MFKKKRKIAAALKTPSRIAAAVKSLPKTGLMLKQRPRPITERTVGRSDLNKDWVDISEEPESRVASARANTKRNVAMIQKKNNDIITEKTSDSMGSWLSRSISLPSKDRVKEILAPSNIKSKLSALGSSVGTGLSTARSGITTGIKGLKSGLTATRSAIRSGARELRSDLADVRDLATESRELVSENADILNLMSKGFTYVTGKEAPLIKEHTQTPVVPEKKVEEEEAGDPIDTLFEYRASKINNALDSGQISYAIGEYTDGWYLVVPEADENDRQHVESMYQSLGYPPHTIEQSMLLMLCEAYISDSTTAESTSDKNVIIFFNKPMNLLPKDLEYILYSIIGCIQIRTYDEPTPHVDTVSGQPISYFMEEDSVTKQVSCSVLWR